MNIIIDLLLVGVLALCTWGGYRKGLILGVSAILALIVAFYGANFLANTYSQEFTSMLEPFISGAVDTAVDDASVEYRADQNKPEDSDEVFDVSFSSLNNLGILKSAAENIASELAADVQEAGNTLKSAMVHKLASTIAYVAVLIIAFILIIIVFSVIANIINLACKLPGLALLNDIGGAAFGLCKGLIIVFALSWALRFFGFVIPMETVDKTLVLSWLMDHNPIVSIFGL